MRMNIEKINQAIDQLRSELKEKISELPDNPKITRTSNNSFTISSRDALLNLTPKYHDYIALTELLKRLIDKTPIEKLSDKLKLVLHERRIPYVEGGVLYYQKISEEFTDLLKKHLI